MTVTDTEGSAAGLWADYDNDGFPDLFVANNWFDNRNTLYHNDRGTDVSRVNATPFTTDYLQAWSADWGDYNNDGWPDVFVQSGDGWSRLFRNAGGLIFADTSIGALTNQNSPIYWADFDDDGRLDYLATHYLGPSYRAVFYHNHNPAANIPPAAPSGLTATVLGGAVQFSWQNAADANQAGGLTYNLRVGKTPGALKSSQHLYLPVLRPRGCPPTSSRRWDRL